MSNNLPPGWSAHIDPSTGQEYYVNSLTQQSQWELPTVQNTQKQRRHLTHQQAQKYYSSQPADVPQQPTQLFTPGIGQQQPMQAQQPIQNLTNDFQQFSLSHPQQQRQSANSINLIGQVPDPNALENDPPMISLPPNATFSQSPTANAHHSFKRSTLNVIPTTQSLLNKFKIPLSLVITPYRSVSSTEEQIPVISDSVISRCRRCRTYINPYVTFLEGGTRWKCSICNLSNEVPQMFDWDPITNQPADRFKRAELNHSVVEFVAPSEYMVRPPQPPVYAFLIDVSYTSVQSGMVATVARTILETLDRIPNEDGRTKVCLIAVDHALHFFNLPPGLTDPNMLVVGDLDDPFLPTPNDLLVNLSEARGAIENLLTNLSDMFQTASGPESAMGTALKAAVQLISPFGGKIMVMTGQLPNVGQGALKNREDLKILGTPKESTLLQAAGGGFYKNLAIDCSRSQISVDMFLFGHPYQDVATLQCLPKYTSGQTYFYPGFNASRTEDALKLAHELSTVLSSPIALEAVMRVRATRGVRMSEYHGNFFVRSTDLLAMPTVPIDQSYCCEITIEENLNVPFVVFQTAVLHTTCYGERRIRVITLSLPTSSNPSEIYASADEQAIATLLANKAVERSQSAKLEDARDAVVNKLVDILGQYKSIMTSGGGASAQLMIPENLKNLPLLMLGLLKNVGIRQSSHIPSDLRAYAQCLLTTLPTQSLIPYLYPTLYSLHNMPMEAGTINEQGLVMPPKLNLTIEKFERHGLYLIEDGQHIFLWIGRDAVPQLVLDVFNLPSLQDLRPGKMTLPVLENPMSERLNAIVNKVRESRRGPYRPHLYLVREDGDPSLRSWALSLLVEDRFEMGLSYTQWLSTLRDKINTGSYN
ncbi:protein transport protein SEC24 [Wallemia mellicola]|nr:protein transport protein SEC24 [Wallemia mellicola]TIB90131.1 protein transport protein SEC24 [Wallemia mellicola]TIC36218.1 protein transport protein SEC24 [Wallemia mellicola]TIC41986.1 protein transport protein SEC24 [Wallemia mellicola]TIC50578.1 protein transport protein SEC24 [Wallemia mellicola]